MTEIKKDSISRLPPTYEIDNVLLLYNIINTPLFENHV
jgi:hypothetical protein